MMRLALLFAFVMASYFGLTGSAVASLGTFGVPSIVYQGPYLLADDAPIHTAAKVYLPRQYSEKTNWPLVVLLHGFTGTGDIENAYLSVSAFVSSRGFILVTPNGSHTPAGIRGDGGRVLDGVPFWNATDACCDFGKTGVDDVAYLKRVLAEVKAQYHVDSSRIYLFGHSNGAFMANRMSCEIGDQIAAIANLAGGTYKNDADCHTPSAVPYLHIHAVDDATISYNDTALYAGGRATIQHWLRRNVCTAAPTTGPAMNNVVSIPGNDTTSEIWNECASEKSVELWTIQAHQARLYNPHIPFVYTEFTGRVLDFLLSKRLGPSSSPALPR